MGLRRVWKPYTAPSLRAEFLALPELKNLCHPFLMKILLLSAYHAPSHQYWAAGLKSCFNDYQWEELVLSPRYFAWRIRGNPLSWATRYREILQQKYDLILATSMVDLACLRGLVPPLGQIPAIVYFHENQFAYPLTENANSVLEAQLVNLYSALSAEVVVFNSHYNQQSFMLGVEALIKKLPDEKPVDLRNVLQRKSRCIPVPLDMDMDMDMDIANIGSDVVNDKLYKIVWNHRWEYDKGPDRLLAIIRKLPADLKLIFHIVGQQFRAQPDSFDEIKNILEARAWLGAWGFVKDREQYFNLLRSADMVLSTAVHDFQGLAMLEATALGCLPLAPERLAYSEFIPAPYLYGSNLDEVELEAEGAAARIQAWVRDPQCRPPVLQSHANQWNWSQMQAVYRDLFESVRGLEVSCASSENNDS